MLLPLGVGLFIRARYLILSLFFFPLALMMADVVTDRRSAAYA